MKIYVVYQSRYWGNGYWGENPKPIAAFTTLKAANAHKRDKDKLARNFYHNVRALNLQETA